jgi:hypothetical protein
MQQKNLSQSSQLFENMSSLKQVSPSNSHSDGDELYAPSESSSPCCPHEAKRRCISDSDTCDDDKNCSPSKSVTFADESEIEEVRADVDEEDRNAMYMSDADQRRIFLDISITVRKAKALGQAMINNKNNPNVIPAGFKLDGIRGLESIILPRNSSRSKRMRAAVVAILDRQLTHAIDEPWLSSTYRPLLTESIALARKRAIRDEAEAKKVALAPRRSSSKKRSTPTPAAPVSCRATSLGSKHDSVSESNMEANGRKRLRV